MSVVVITGCSSGIGLSSAIAFARAGHRVVATMRNLAKAGEPRETAMSAGVELDVRALDVTDADSVAAFFDAVHADEGRVDVLVNNAGIGGASPLEMVPEDEHRAIFETNYWGVVRCTQAVLPGMRARGSGSIVNVSSAAGRLATPNQVPYSASKWALEAMSESLAYEMRPFGVRVAIVEPGYVTTKVFENSAEYTRYDKTSPYKPLMQRSGWLYRAGATAPSTPESVADVIVEATLSPDAALRHIVGADSRGLIEGRAGISDEEYLDLADLDDEAYRRRFAEIFGIDL